ncbi:porin family protein [Formosa algae]|uniref:Outer membrane protein beta-barrel domain-containing protein n=1 Tax=Formosa algae TaxID=225843 RepID=A0A9X1C8D2_9FLAO|nr:porin family protein [Formosa algae]MBP1839086.1 hypothetical protein [Formosa algae]MDQ0333863.1 hypothetical protein [Formosa algae]OEI80922.1 PorT protein [Formosa algae]
MRKLIVVLFLTLISQTSFAQLFSKEKILNNENFDKDRFSYGYFLGFNNYGFDFEYEDGKDEPQIQVEKGIGFSVGLLGNMRINDYFDLRFEPGLYITNRDLTFPEEYFTDLGYTYDDSDLKREVKSTYIHLPLIVKFSSKRINNFKPFITGGVSMSLNLNSNENNTQDNHNGQFRMTKNTYYYEFGFGIDLYLQYFKFTPSIRGVFALNDELVRDDPNEGPSPWTDNIASMKSQGLFINFTFQ